MGNHSFVRISGLLCLAALGIGCGSKAADSQAVAPKSGAAATVNGEPINIEDYYLHMGAKQTAQVMTRNGPAEQRVVGSFGLQALQELVDQKILMQMAKEQNVAPTEAEVDAELKFQTDARHDYLKLLEDEGMTPELIRNEQRVQLAREHLVMKGITVDPAEVDQYIKGHPEKFSEPERAKLLFIQVATPEAKAKVDSALASGKAFGVVASQYSVDPSAKSSLGAYVTDIVPQMPKVLQDLVKKTSEKAVSDWIKSGPSYFKFFVDKKTAGSLKTPTAQEREFVRRGIAMQKGEKKNDFDHMFLEKLKAAKVDIVIPNLKTPWDKTWNQLTGSSGAPAH